MHIENSVSPLALACRIGVTMLAATFVTACGGGGSSDGSGNGAGGGTLVTPGTLQLSAAAGTVGESAGNAVISITRTGGSSGVVGATVSTSAGTATAGSDFTSTTTTVSFADGDVASKTVSIPIANDTVHEADKSFSVTLSAASGGASLGSPTTATVTIADDDLATHQIGGMLLGLAGGGLILRNSGGNDLAVTANGSFQFSKEIAEGAAYNVTVGTQPTAPLQKCIVTGGSGVVATANVLSVSVSCTTVVLDSLLIRRTIGGAGGQSDLLFVKEDGSAFQPLANSTDSETLVGVAPSGRIVFRRDTATTTGLYSVNPDGTGLVTMIDSNKRITLGNGFTNLITASNQVVFEIATTTSNANVSDIQVAKLDGTQTIPLAANAANDEEVKGITANQRVVYSSSVGTGGQDDLFSIKTDGTGVATLSNAPEFDEFVALTPGGRVLFHRIVGSQRDLYSVKDDGTGLVALANTATNEEFVAVIANERVIYRKEIAAFQNDLYAVNADGTAQVALANSADNEFFVLQTPSSRIVYTRLSAGQADMYAVNPDGTQVTPLGVTPDIESASAVSPTGQVLFARITSGQSDLYSINADGTGEKRLTNTPEDESINAAASTADGKLIFVREATGINDLYSINYDGTNEVRLTNTPEDELPGAITSNGLIVYSRSTGTQSDLLGIRADGTGAITFAATADSEVLERLYTPP